MKFRKKPVVIEAHQLVRDETSIYGDWPEWLQLAFRNGIDKPGCVWPAGDSIHALEIGTLEGNHKAAWGDWIIQGVKGELYPCKPDIFAATYEQLNDDP